MGHHTQAPGPAFGYRYDYRARTVSDDAYLGPLPDGLRAVAAQLVASGHFDRMPDQVIANEYQPGQGISAHIDCEPCFGETIASLSLLSACEMIFRHAASGEKHARRSDVIEGVRRMRERRISLTFRTVIEAR